ncbi:DUF421 domain-containing protein [Paenibacillus sp. CN-4]|uniref:DUF421 domain-containing protein n=1 Tax=Paenibacillus nanchangensis TaxID=3348343 RepID=UPI00397C6575
MFRHISAHVSLTLLMYLFTFLSLRVMGKREIAQLSVLDLVISIMIAETGVFVIEDIERPITDGLVPMVTLVLIQVLLAWISLKSRRFRLWLDGKPSIIVSEGKLHRGEMRKQRYNLDDLLVQLREQNIHTPADVEFAILEPTGKLTVIDKSVERPTNKPRTFSAGKPGNIKLPLTKIRYEGLPIPLIMDGVVQDKNLEMIGKTRFWLRTQIRQKGVADFRDVFLCTVDYKGKMYIDPMRNKK